MRYLFMGFLLFTTLGVNALSSQEAFIELLDTDKDGFINLREAVKNTDLLRAFGKIDINEDGKISEAELISSDYAREVLAIPV